jgi:hypothetical protein
MWVFNGEGARFPSGVFSSRENAEAWIAKHALTGVLTAYPVDQGVYDWAVEKGLFRPKATKNIDARFIGGFTSASQEHFHYYAGTSTDQAAPE